MHDNNWIFGYTFGAGNTDGTLLHFENGYPEFKLENVQQDYFSLLHPVQRFHR
jgi:hypothetical protein